MFGMKNRIIITLLSLATIFSNTAHANDSQPLSDTTRITEIIYNTERSDMQDDIKFFFHINKFDFIEDYSTNAINLLMLDQIMADETKLLGLDSIEIHAAASIDGRYDFNEYLAKNRAQTVRDIIAKRYNSINPSLFKATWEAEDWDGFLELVKADNNLPNKNEVVGIITNDALNADQKEYRLRNLAQGRPWNYMAKHILPKSRYGASLIFHYKIDTTKEVIHTDTILERDTIIIVKEVTPPVVEPAPDTRPFRMAIKTNLLYAGLTLTPNLGFEIGLSDKMTLDFTGGYNPWNLEGRPGDNKKLVHWLAKIESRLYLDKAFEGHFFGAHVLGGEFNIGNHELPLLFGKGSEAYRYEGWAAGVGLTYGYQWRLSKRFNLEASIGLGYAYLNYDRWEHPRCGTFIDKGTKHYFGPTNASISIVYRFGKW